MRKHIFFIFILFLSCCGSLSVPEWYINTQENTNNTLYGYGASIDKSQSVHEAITNLQERVYVSLSSKTSMQDASINGKSVNEYSKNIKIKIPKISITNYKIEKSELVKNVYYTFVSIDKLSLVESVAKKLQKTNESIQNLFNEYNSTKHSVQKVFAINSLNEKCQSQVDIQNFYNALGYMIPNSICEDVSKLYQTFKTTNDIHIVNSNPSVYSMLVNIFSQKFTLNNKSQNIITYSIKSKTSKISNGFLAGVTINIIQYNTDEAFYKNCIGTSNISEDKAIENAIEKCYDESKNITFEEFFNKK